MLCGSSHVDLDDFVEFAVNDNDTNGDYSPGSYWLAIHTPRAPKWTDLAWYQCWAIKHYRAQIFRSEGRCLKSKGIHLLIHRLRLCRVKEAVDRIWAIFALLEQDVQRSLVSLIDYSDEGRAKYYEAYTRATKVLIENRDLLDLLSIPPSVEANEALPSWCPNLSGQTACLMTISGLWNDHTNATGQPIGLKAEDDEEARVSRRVAVLLHSQRPISFANEDELLYVRGFVVDTISEVIEDQLLLGRNRWG